MNNPQIVSDNDKEKEIDLLELAYKLWAKRLTILKWCAVGACIGLVVAFSIPREYSTVVKLSPELNNGKTPGGDKGALASLVGVNLSSGATSDAVYPELYPDVLTSKPFMVELLGMYIPTEDGPATVMEILEDRTSVPWWGVILGLPGKAISGVMSLFSDDDDEAGGDSINAFRLTPKQNRLVEALSNRITVDVNSKTSVVTIGATLQDPLASAHLADSVVTRLQKYITEYRTEKARQDLEYNKRINNEARDTYYEAQKRYAEASDRNHSLSSRSARIDLERLQNEASLAFNLYNSTAQQAQLAEAKVQETTPVFAVVQPASVPVKPSKPSKMMILIGFIFLSFVAAGAYILYFPVLKSALSAHKE